MRTSASVRYPYFRISSSVMILTDDGASETRCSYFEAPYTDGMSRNTIDSSARSVEGPGSPYPIPGTASTLHATIDRMIRGHNLNITSQYTLALNRIQESAAVNAGRDLHTTKHSRYAHGPLQ